MSAVARRRPRHRPFLLIALLAVLLLPVLPVPAPAAAGSFVGMASGRCLDVHRNTNADGADVIIYDCHGSYPNQAWTFTSADELRVFAPARCLDVADPTAAPPLPVVIWTCDGRQSQRWSIRSDGAVVNGRTGLCLGVAGAATGNWSGAVLTTCQRVKDQRWQAPARTDTRAPSAPTQPRSAGLTCSSVTFAWNPAQDNVGVTAYDVYHDGQLITSVGGSTLATSLRVVPGAGWGLYVNARDGAGNVSQASATVTVTPPACGGDGVAPTAPTALTARADGTTVALTWKPASDNVGVRTYQVLRDGRLVGIIPGTALVPPAAAFLDSALTPKTRYSYSVLAFDAVPNRSAASASVAVITGASCTAICTVRRVATDTDIPWGLADLPDGSVLYSRRDAHDLVRLDPRTGVRTDAGTVPGVSGTDGEGGLLGLAVRPDFATDPWVYLMYTTATDNRIVRMRYAGGTIQPNTRQVLVSGILRNKYHDGGRLRFGPDGTLYASTGDAQNGALAQDRTSLNGKILRLNSDGSVPRDNPFGTYVWSYGHRNPQGLAFDAQGRLWEQEFGNAAMDETNLIVKGGNYGWPACEGTQGACDNPAYRAPKHTYPTVDGSCSGLTVVRGSLYVACARGARLYRATISGSGNDGALTAVRAYLVGTYGRLRTVEPAADGGLWLTTTGRGDKDSIPDNSAEMILHLSVS